MRMSQVIDFLIYIYPQIKNNKLKIQAAYKLSKCVDFCEKEAQFYTNKLSEIFEKYGQRDDTGALKQDPETKGVLIDVARKNECEHEINELLNLEVPVDDNLLISINDIESFELNIESFRKIKPFIKD